MWIERVYWYYILWRDSVGRAPKFVSIIVYYHSIMSFGYFFFNFLIDSLLIWWSLLFCTRFWTVEISRSCQIILLLTRHGAFKIGLSIFGLFILYLYFMCLHTLIFLCHMSIFKPFIRIRYFGFSLQEST